MDEGIILRAMNESKVRRRLLINPLLARHFDVFLIVCLVEGGC